MKKISSVLAPALAALTFAASFGCATPYDAGSAGGKQKYIPHPEVVSNSHGENNETIGRQISKILKKEFDHVNYYNFNGDLVIRGEEEMDGKYYTTWGINLNCVCEAYTLGRPVLDVLLGRKVIAEECNGDVVPSYSMSKNTAITFAEILDLYTSNNAQRCKDWIEFMKQNYGPFAPKDQREYF